MARRVVRALACHEHRVAAIRCLNKRRAGRPRLRALSSIAEQQTSSAVDCVARRAAAGDRQLRTADALATLAALRERRRIAAAGVAVARSCQPYLCVEKP